MESKQSYAVKVDRVSKFYGDFAAVSELSFEIPAGCIYGVLGPNGAGKTTTLRMMNDIILPDRGEIRLVGGLPPGEQAGRRIGYLPEERGLYPKMKVVELLQFFGELRGLDRADAGRRADRWLERLEIADWRANKVQDLSKGMQQKVQFASALIHEPELLILDEPWSGLDPINADVLRDVVLEQRAAGKTILFSTHLMEQAEQICDRVCIIARGKRALEGDLAEIKREATRDRVIAVSFSDDAGRARAEETILADEALVTSVTPHKAHLEVELAADAIADQLLAAITGAKLSVRKFEIVEPSLHEIFVDRVGAEAAADRSGREVAHA